MMKRIAKWLLRDYIHEREEYWFATGANQAYYEPDSVSWVLQRYVEYWGEEE